LRQLTCAQRLNEIGIIGIIDTSGRKMKIA
jgi:hypothetical protein